MRIVSVECRGKQYADVCSKSNYTGYSTPTGCVVRYGGYWWEVQVFPHRGAVMDGDFMREGLREEFQAWIQLLR